MMNWMGYIHAETKVGTSQDVW